MSSAQQTNARYVLQDDTEIAPPRSLEALARLIAKDCDSGRVRPIGQGGGQELRDRWGGWLSSHVRRDLFRLIDREDLIHETYDHKAQAAKKRHA